MNKIKRYLNMTWAKLAELYGRNILLFIVVTAPVVFLLCVAAFTFFNSAAPTTVTIASGPKGSLLQSYAEKYQAILAKEGVTVKIVPSDGSIDNLDKLLERRSKIDVGFVQGGTSQGKKIDGLMSLGSIAYQPIMIFYHGEGRHLISEFRGSRLNIGPDGSGAHSLALAILKENGLEPGRDFTAVENDSRNAVGDLLENRVDAVFVMGDTASVDLMRKLVETPGINIYNFGQAEGYTRRIRYLNKLVLPEGALDLGKNIPVNDLYLVAPSIELIAQKNLHPALSDLLLEAAREVHGTAGLFRKAGQFPAPLEQDFHISPDANRYYTSGKSFLYRTFPFWVASLISRLLALLVPIVLLLIPAMRIAPAIYRWHIQSRIYPWYKALLELERDAFDQPVHAAKREQLLQQLDHIENAVNHIKIPASFGDSFYGLRGHISFVRQRLLHESKEATADGAPLSV